MAQDDKNDKGAVIHIDKKTYRWTGAVITGAELRTLADPDIAANFEVRMQVPGGEDRPVGDSDEIEVKPGLHFFSIPTNINAGA